jgi:hypothetical protein
MCNLVRFYQNSAQYHLKMWQLYPYVDRLDGWNQNEHLDAYLHYTNITNWLIFMENEH